MRLAKNEWNGSEKMVELHENFVVLSLSRV